MDIFYKYIIFWLSAKIKISHPLFLFRSGNAGKGTIFTYGAGEAKSIVK